MTRSGTATASDGRPIHAVSLRSDQLCARVVTLGAALQDLRLVGVDHPLVLGYEDVTHYTTNPAYLGTVVGRVANRISGGKIALSGQIYALNCNEGDTTCLHGGRDGLSHRNWQISDRSQAHVTLCDTLPDGHMGFPGRVEVTATYRLDGPRLSISLTATTDALTVCNLAPHTYFNLDGRADISGHHLSVAASHVLPVEKGLPVSGPVRADALRLDLQRASAVPQGVDHNYCLSEQVHPLRPVATLSTAALSMTVSTTEPGLQVYDGSKLAILGGGLGGRRYAARAGVALEPQRWIDAPNQPWHRQTRLRPGDPYHAQSIFHFERITGPTRA